MHSASPSSSPPLGNLLLLALNRRGLSITEAANRIPMNRGTLNRILNGSSDPTWSTLRRICDGLGIPLEELEGKEARAN